MNDFKIIARNKLDELPKTSGVYLFFARRSLGEGGLNNPIYIGKAINIRDRVKNHFNQPSYRDDLFIGKVSKVGFLETNSEIEALILEANLIKKYQPKYNVMWRDDKNYFYVATATNEQKIPYIFITHQLKNKLEIRNLKLGIRYIGPFVEGTALKKTLRFLRRAFPYYTVKKHSKNKCTWCHLGLCPGPKPDLQEYKKNIKKLVLVLSGKRGAVLNSLKKEMRRLSKENRFEEAAKIRDRIYNLQQVMSHAHVIESAKVSPTLNVRETLGKIIGSKKPIKRIECYDVSNMQGKFATGSMVVFINGNPDKKEYKKFKIKMENEPNDIAMLKEILERRFKHQDWPFPNLILIDGGKAQLNIAVKTIEQSHVIARSIKVVSIAKGKQDPLRPRSEARLFIENKKTPIPLKRLPQEIYNLIKNLDDEAHRFAITYHKKLRKKSLLYY